MKTDAVKLLLLPDVKGNKLNISNSFASESAFFQRLGPLPASESVWLGCNLINGYCEEWPCTHRGVRALFALPLGCLLFVPLQGTRKPVLLNS